jgi:uncharacterized membrane protein
VLTALAAATAFVYFVAPENSGWYWQCPFHAWIGLLCPGCGGTRAVHAMLHGEFTEAMRLNALAVVVFVCAWTTVVAQWYSPMAERMHRASLHLRPRRPQLALATGCIVGVFTFFHNLFFRNLGF